MNPRLRIMVDSREIEAAEAPDREVVARWRKAVGTYGMRERISVPTRSSPCTIGLRCRRRRR